MAVGAAILIIGGLWEVVSQWSVAYSVLTDLQSKGPAGMFVASILLSPTLRLILIAIGLAIVLKDYLENRHAAKSLLAVTPSTASIVPLYVEPKESPRDERIFLPEEITIKSLVDLTQGLTEVQAQGLIGPYIGKWKTVSGPIGNVTQDEFSKRVALDIRIDDLLVMLWFDGRWLDRLTILPPRHMIRANGKISNISRHGLWLSQCELL